MISSSQSKLKALLSCILLIIAAYMQTATDAWMMHSSSPTTITPRRHCCSRGRHRPSHTIQFAFRNPQEFLKLSPLATSTMAVPMLLASSSIPSLLDESSTMVVAASNPFSDPTVEAEILTDLAHVGLDMFTFFGPAKLITRFAAVVGRVLAMAADYIPDHKMLPEELVFQVIMLSVGWYGLVSAALPMALATLSGKNVTVRDGKAFSRLFEPIGLSWHQFKAVSALSLDWITLEPGQVILDEKQDDGKYVYWLYSGKTSVSRDDKILYNVTSCKSITGKALLGEARLVADTTYTPITAVVAGESGATLLRINVESLKALTSTDQDLAESMRKLVFKGMDDKLAAAFLEEK